MKQALLLSRSQGFGTPDGHQIMPFEMYRTQIESNLQLEVINSATQSPQERTSVIDRVLTSNNQLSHILVMPHWSEDPQELCAWFDQTRALIQRAGLSETKIVMLDYYAPTCSPHFSAMAHVDRYIKRQTLSDLSGYEHEYRSGFAFADFVADTWGFELEDWHFGSKIPAAHAHKLVSGWNLGITPRYEQILNWTKRVPIPWSLRRIDIHQRIGGLGKPGQKQEWYQFSRAKGIEALDPLKSKYRMSTIGRVSRKKYFLELCSSKVVFSPFGWGEVCFRDYEAIACGALLVKPDMSHVTTEPNIYIANETYIPVAWDYSDAADKVEECLSNPNKAKKIVANARRVLSEYYTSARFVDTLGDCLGISENQQ
ncbi:MAG: glycosyltransferase [Phycisphaerales bacterium]|nr:glycosyltransferase [Phycisphaerales bacterium]